MPGRIARTEEEFRIHFDTKIDKTSDASGCWLWTGCKNVYGYGEIKWKGKLMGAHKVSFLLSDRTIPANYDICHSEHCVGKRHCVNPAHLSAKSRAENMADKIRDGTDDRGEKSSLAKLTEIQVLEIRGRSTENQCKLAEEFGISNGTINHIIRRRRWKHI
jgi:hypothetical protein